MDPAIQNISRARLLVFCRWAAAVVVALHLDVEADSFVRDPPSGLQLHV